LFWYRVEDFFDIPGCHPSTKIVRSSLSARARALLVARILYHYTERDLTTPSAAQAIGNRSNFPPSFARLTWGKRAGGGAFCRRREKVMAAILAQNPLVTFRLPCGKVSRDSPLNMAKIGIASAKRDQSPIRSRCSHWRNSPVKPMLSAILKLAMTHRSICFPDFRQFCHRPPIVPPGPRRVLLDGRRIVKQEQLFENSVFTQRGRVIVNCRDT
jgi:hypothetical protein